MFKLIIYQIYIEVPVSMTNLWST